LGAPNLIYKIGAVIVVRPYFQKLKVRNIPDIMSGSKKLLGSGLYNPN